MYCLWTGTHYVPRKSSQVKTIAAVQQNVKQTSLKINDLINDDMTLPTEFCLWHPPLCNVGHDLQLIRSVQKCLQR